MFESAFLVKKRLQIEAGYFGIQILETRNLFVMRRVINKYASAVFVKVFVHASQYELAHGKWQGEALVEIGGATQLVDQYERVGAQILEYIFHFEHFMFERGLVQLVVALACSWKYLPLEV